MTTAGLNVRTKAAAIMPAYVDTIMMLERLLDRLNIHTIDGFEVRAQVVGLVAHHLKPGMFHKAGNVGDGAFRRLAQKVDLELLARAMGCDGVMVDSEAALEPALVIDNVYGETMMLPLTELAEKHFGTLPAVFGPTVG